MTNAERSRRFRERHPERAKEIHRKYEQTPAGRENKRKTHRAWVERNREHMRERRRIGSRLRRAVLAGLLVKTPCLMCGEAKVHGHHHNGYDAEHELDVIWLCASHHMDVHGRGKKG